MQNQINVAWERLRFLLTQPTPILPKSYGKDKGGKAVAFLDIPTANYRDSVGIYGPPATRIIKNCFSLVDGEIFVLLNTFKIATPVIIACKSNLKSHTLVGSENMTVLDCSRDKLLVNFSTPTSAPTAKVLKVLNRDQDPVLEPINETKDYPECSDFEWEIFVHAPRYNKLLCNVSVREFRGGKLNSIFLKARTRDVLQRKGKVPLIVWPHGGPVSLFPASYNQEANFFMNCGFDVLMINYRGSTGMGQDNIESLFGHEGILDVDDCRQATEECLEMTDNEGSVFLFGGSHGGFIALHLAQKYPETYKAAAVRNPNTNLVSKYTDSDILCAQPKGEYKGYPEGIQMRSSHF